MKRKVMFFLLFCLYVITGYCQIKVRSAGSFDSLIKATEVRKNDTIKLKKLFVIWEVFEHGGRMDTSLYYLKQAYNLATRLNNREQIANACLSMGGTYYDLGAYPQALDSYIKALKAAQLAGSKFYIASATCNLGLVYFAENEIDTALAYYMKALKMDEHQHDSSNMTAAATDVGTVYYQKKNYPEALKYFQMCLHIDTRRHYINGIGPDLDNIGSIYMEEHKYDSALVYLKKSIKASAATSDVLGMLTGEMNLGEAYLGMKRYDEADKLLTHAYSLADTVHSLDDKKNCSHLLSELYADKGDWQKAYKYFQTYIVTKDSLVGETRGKEIGRIEAKSGYDKQLALQKAESDKKEALNEAESKRQKIVIGFGIVITLAIAIIAFIIFRSLKTTRKQKELIEEQKKEVEEKKALVEEKNREVLDSITYAKRLQDAILPPISQIKKHLPESFVLFKPKDIVAGDFYFFSPFEQGVIIAACDCTGHGVPGAMVSVVCSNALNRTVKEFGISNPGKILDKTRELVLETFEKSGGDIKDGMDVSLTAIIPASPPSEGGIEVRWAGAYNYLCYVFNNELIEINGDKQPIGVTDNPKPFTTHTIKLNPPLEGREAGTCIYLFTDGYADQFGGPKGKKFMIKKLREKLLAISHRPMAEQEQLLDTQFEDWKGMMEQTDDVCIIGIRV